MVFNKLPGYSIFYHEGGILTFCYLIFDRDSQAAADLISTFVEVSVIVYQACCHVNCMKNETVDSC